ncbi:MAG: DNA polymerase I [Polyangiales bacterium]
MATKKAPPPAPSNDLPVTKLPDPGDPNALYIVDLSGYVFRAYHAVAPLSNSKGEPTHAVFGTVMLLERLLKTRRPGHLAVAMDSKAPSFRKAIDPRYKANRPEPPPDLSQQIQRCEQVVRAWSMATVRRDGIEADDLIAAIAKRTHHEHPDVKVVVVSADKDLMQLCEGGAILWDSMRDRVYGPREVTEKFGVGPEKLRDLLALMGDSSDNVPGVPGVGPKTAADLLTQFASLDDLYARLDEVARPKLRDALRDNEAEARLSQRLVTLKDDEEIAPTFESFAWTPLRGAAALPLKALFVELEFGRLAEAVDVREDGSAEKNATSDDPPAKSQAPSEVARTYRAITSRLALESFVDAARSVLGADPRRAIAIDTESTSLRPVDATLVGLSMSFDTRVGFYVPIAHRYLGVPAQLSLDDVREVLAPFFADASIPKVGHNLKFDGEMLEVAGMPLAGIRCDSMLAHYLLDPEAPHGLKELAASQLGVQMTTYDQVTRRDASKRGHQLAFDEVPIEEATPYAAADAALSLALVEGLEGRIDSQGLTKLLHDVEMPMSAVLTRMELDGVLIDGDVLRSLSRDVDGMLRDIEVRAREILKASPEVVAHAAEIGELNLSSPRQLEAVLFDVLKLPVIKRTKTSRSTDADVLEELVDKHPLPAVVLEHRQLQKLKGTYLDALPRMISPKTGRVHTNYQQHVAATGRLSSTDPNLQNIPIRTELGRRIRAAFVAPPGMSILSADYSQIELRVLADLAHDEILIDAFQHGEDVHSRTARELFMHDRPTDATPTKEDRRRAKAVNFGVVYGQGESALGKQLGIPRDEAASFIDKYFQRYAGVRRYMDEQIEIARRGEGVRTLLGRRRFLPDIHSANRALRLQAERIARNTPIQGSAADILKLAMIALATPPVPGATMILTVHDELVFEVPTGREEEAASVVREKMSSVVKLAVPLVVDVGWGASWADAHG